MAATLSRVAVNQDGSLHFILIPDDDKELADPAYAPQGKATVNFPRGSIVDRPPFRNLMAFIQPQIAQAGHASLAVAIGARVSLIDAQTQAQADQAALAIAIAGVDPIAIAAAQLKAATSAQAIVTATAAVVTAAAASIAANGNGVAVSGNGAAVLG